MQASEHSDLSTFQNLILNLSTFICRKSQIWAKKNTVGEGVGSTLDINSVNYVNSCIPLFIKKRGYYHRGTPKMLKFCMYSKRPPSSLDSCFITVCLRALCAKHCTHTAVMTKRPPHTWKKSLMFALHSWVHFCVRLLFHLYQIHPPPDYQIFFVVSSLVNKIERPTSYNIYVGISFTMLINARN